MKRVALAVTALTVFAMMTKSSLAQRPNRPREGGVDPAAFDAPPLAKDEAEKRILDAMDQMRQGPRYRNVSVTDGRLLRLLAETTGAKRVVEIGASTGESAVWFALALRSTGGHLFTHEIDPERAKIAEENFKKAGVDGLITIIVGDAHQTVLQHKEPIDILFLDADKQGYIDYLEKLLPQKAGVLASRVIGLFPSVDQAQSQCGSQPKKQRYDAKRQRPHDQRIEAECHPIRLVHYVDDVTDCRPG